MQALRRRSPTSATCASVEWQTQENDKPRILSDETNPERAAGDRSPKQVAHDEERCCGIPLLGRLRAHLFLGALVFRHALDIYIPVDASTKDQPGSQAPRGHSSVTDGSFPVYATVVYVPPESDTFTGLQLFLDAPIGSGEQRVRFLSALVSSGLFGMGSDWDEITFRGRRATEVKQAVDLMYASMGYLQPDPDSFTGKPSGTSGLQLFSDVPIGLNERRMRPLSALLNGRVAWTFPRSAATGPRAAVGLRLWPPSSHRSL